MSSRLILISLFLASNSLAGEAFGCFSCKDDSLSKVNELIANSLPAGSAQSLETVVEVAELKLKDASLDQHMKNILRTVADLKIFTRDGTYSGSSDCSPGMIALLSAVHQSMLQSSRRDAYAEPQSQRLLNKLVIDLQTKFAKLCFEKFTQEFAPYYRAMTRRFIDAKDAIGQLLDLIKANPSLGRPLYKLDKLNTAAFERVASRISVPNAMTWVESLQVLHDIYYGTYKLKSNDTKSGNLIVSQERTRKVFDELLVRTCNSLESNEKLGDVLEKTAALAKAVRLNNSMIDNKYSEISDELAAFAITKQFCKLMKMNMDKEKAIKRLSMFISCCEETTAYSKMSLVIGVL